MGQSESEYEYESESESENESDYDPDEVIDEIYEDVESFDDLLDVNVKFLKNEIYRTYYYLAEFGRGCGTTHEPRREALINLHTKHRVYTINGQVNMFSETLIQQSYLEFIVDEPLGEKLEPLLFDCPLIYTCVSYYRYQDDNFPTRRYNLTRDRKCVTDEWREYTNWWRNNRYSDEMETPYHNVDHILSDCRVFFIVVRDPLCGQESDEILRGILERI